MAFSPHSYFLLKCVYGLHTLHVISCWFQLESTIKQAEEERNRAAENTKKLYNEYIPVKQQVDHLRSTVGLDPLPSLDEEEQFAPEYVCRHCRSISRQSACFDSSFNINRNIGFYWHGYLEAFTYKF